MIKLICIGGIPGIGKSTIGELLLPYFKEERAVLVCPDRTRLEVLGKPEGSAITIEDITPRISEKTIALMKQKTEQFLIEDKTVIVPSAFFSEKMRLSFETIAQNNNVEFYGFWLDAPYETIRHRAEERAKNESTVSRIIPDKTFIPEGKITWTVINAEGSSQGILLKLTKLL